MNRTAQKHRNGFVRSLFSAMAEAVPAATFGVARSLSDLFYNFLILVGIAFCLKNNI